MVAGWYTGIRGAVAQLGEHLLCKQGVNGSIPFSSTIFSNKASRLDLLLQVEHLAECKMLNLEQRCSGRPRAEATNKSLL